MLLMMKDKPVLECDTKTKYYKILNKDLLPLQIKNKIKELTDYEDNNLTVEQIREKNDIANNNNNAIIHFLSSRVLNLDRENAKKILNAFNLSQSQDDETRAKIAITCKAVSMTDCYWLKIGDEEINWNDINPKKVSLNKIITHIALKGSSLTLQGKPLSPELTTQGACAKAWIRENDNTYLLKKSSKNSNESDIEIMVSNLLDCFNIPHVKYTESFFENEKVSKCKNMTTDDLSIISAEDMYSYLNRSEQEDIINYAISKDPENFYKMAVIDYLISNSDRHMKNWGFYYSNDNNEIIALHPLFDHNNAFDIEDIKEESGGPSLLFQNKTKKEVAEYAIKKCNICCIKPINKDMFINNAMYESFMTRAMELGLCIEKQPTLLQKLHIQSFERYEMKIDINDDEEIYYQKLNNKILKIKNNINQGGGTGDTPNSQIDKTEEYI